jgi:hypothetical protein
VWNYTSTPQYVFMAWCLVKHRDFTFISYIILRGRWCDIIVLHVHAPTEDKGDDIKVRFARWWHNSGALSPVHELFKRPSYMFVSHQEI